MTEKEVKATLGSYKENKARLEFLRTEAEALRIGVSVENLPEVHAIGAQTYDHIPIKGKKDSIVETLGLRSLDGETYETANRWQRELDAISQEICQKERAIRLVDIWLSALRDTERVVIEWHEIDQKTWEQISLASHRILDHFTTVDGVRGIGRRALKKIYNIAR